MTSDQLQREYSTPSSSKFTEVQTSRGPAGRDGRSDLEDHVQYGKMAPVAFAPLRPHGFSCGGRARSPASHAIQMALAHPTRNATRTTQEVWTPAVRAGNAKARLRPRIRIKVSEDVHQLRLQELRVGGVDAPRGRADEPEHRRGRGQTSNLKPQTLEGRPWTGHQGLPSERAEGNAIRRSFPLCHGFVSKFAVGGAVPSDSSKSCFLRGWWSWSWLWSCIRHWLAPTFATNVSAMWRRIGCGVVQVRAGRLGGSVSERYMFFFLYCARRSRTTVQCVGPAPLNRGRYLGQRSPCGMRPISAGSRDLITAE